MNPTQTAPLDPQVVSLAQSIRTVESNNNFSQTGKSGEIGAYQWMPATWQGHAKEVLGDPNAPMTPQNQNAVAYSILKGWKDQGLNPAQIAAKWNSGSETGWENKVGTNAKGVAYDVPAYVKKVTDLYQANKPAANPLGLPTANASTGSNPGMGGEPGSNPAFPYAAGDNGLTAGLKALGNLPGSAAGFAKNTAEGFNPIQILNNVGQIGSGLSDLASQEGVGHAILDVLKGIPKAAYDTLVPEGVRDVISGDTAGAAKAFTNDPFGQTAPVVLGAVGGAEALDRVTGKTVPTPAVPGQTMFVNPQGVVSGAERGAAGAAVDRAISTIGGGPADAISGAAGKVTGAVSGPLGKAAGLAAQLTRSIASHLTSLNPETITQILETPDAFTKIAQDQLNRGSIFESVKSGLDTLEGQFAENGKLYQATRAGTEVIKVPENFISDALAKHGLKLELDPETGNQTVVADTKSLTRDKGDLAAIQNFVDNWGKTNALTPDEFLNMRSDLSKMAKYGKEIGRNDGAEIVSRDLRSEANKGMRPQISGLKELDESAAPTIDLLKRVKKDLMNADGTFKDNAPSKIVNSLTKEGLLSRLEKLHPGITKQLQILKAVEDIERAKGIKVGSYARGAIEGYGALTGNLPAVAAAIITNPTMAVPIIRGLALTKAQTGAVLTVLKAVGGDVASTLNHAPDKILR